MNSVADTFKYKSVSVNLTRTRAMSNTLITESCGCHCRAGRSRGMAGNVGVLGRKDPAGRAGTACDQLGLLVSQLRHEGFLLVCLFEIVPWRSVQELLSL